MSKKLTVSYSALSAYFSGCNAQYPWYTQYNVKKTPAWFVFGNEFHGYMEHDEVPAKAKGKAADLARRTFEYLDKQGYTLLEQAETKHLARLTSTIDVYGKIDRWAIDPDGVPVVIDWKTAKSPWSTLKRIDGGKRHASPQAMSWQGTLYTIDPYDEDPDIFPWPDITDFVVAPKDGGKIRVHRYYQTEKDVQNLIAAAQTVEESVRTGRFSKNFGYLCTRCKWKEVCHDIPGWEKKYEERKSR